MDVRRMLVIGLGTSGVKVCNQMLERLTEFYGSAESVPWVRFLAIDTAEVPRHTQIAREPKVDRINLEVDRALYHQIVERPGEYGDEIDLPSWIIPDVTRLVCGIEGGHAFSATWVG